MILKQLKLFVIKEFYHVFRDRQTLLLLFGLPIVQIVLFGFALSNEIKNSNIAVLDQSQDLASKHIITKLDHSTNFKITYLSHKNENINTLFKAGDISLVVVIPPHFYEDLNHLNVAGIQLIADASDPNTATSLVNFATQIIMDYQQSLTTVQGIPRQITPEIRMFYNPELKGTTNYVPGVLSLILLLICVLMTSVSIVREKENGTMEVLLVSPFNPYMVVISKAIPYLILSIINLIMILLLSYFLLDMPFNGNVLLFFLLSVLFIITALSLGLLISNMTDSQQTAMLISLMGMLLPTVMFTGFMFPIENMPYPLQIMSNIVPSKWYYIIVKSIMIKGLGFMSIWKETVILLGMTVILLSISIKKFKMRLE